MSDEPCLITSTLHLEVRGLGLGGVLHGVRDKLVRPGGVLKVFLHHDALSHPGVSHVQHVVPATGKTTEKIVVPLKHCKEVAFVGTVW